MLENCALDKVEGFRGQLRELDYLINGHFAQAIERGEYKDAS